METQARAEEIDGEPTLLATKLMIPAIHQQLVSRPRLYRLLDQGLQGALTLLVAPAGSGKTTLVGEWLRRRETAAAWLSLEEADNEPERFWRYLITALARLAPTLDKCFATSLCDDPGPQAYKAPLTTLINALMDLPHESVFVLDDYHTITEPRIQNMLQFLLEHLPPALHLCLISRNEPPLSLARLRVQGTVMDIAARELNFSDAETEAFLAQIPELANLPLHADALRELQRRSEGWIAGLCLFSHRLRGQDDPSALDKALRAFHGSQQYIRRYLNDEVLERQPVALQEFLLTTAILKQLHAGLCDAVTGRQNGREMLRQLVTANLFLHPLDEQDEWYRYNILFSEMLHHQLINTQPTLLPELHRRACAWYEQQGLTGEAIEHAQAGGDSERAADLHARLRVQMREEHARPFQRLSEREQAVLRLMAEGMSNQEIARALVVTVSTVKTHLNNIYAKLQVHTRLQAVTRAYELLPPPQTQ